MDFVDRIVGHDIWFTGQLLDLAGRVEPDDLDRPVVQDVGALTDSTVTLRELLNELVSTRENWSATLAGRDAPPEGSTTLDDLKRRFAVAGKEFASLVRAIRDRGEWDDAFVDALCDPPRSFTYGGMLAHVTTFSAVRRTMAVSALRKLGVEGVGLGDPIEWEHAVT